MSEAFLRCTYLDYGLHFRFGIRDLSISIIQHRVLFFTSQSPLTTDKLLSNEAPMDAWWSARQPLSEGFKNV